MEPILLDIELLSAPLSSSQMIWWKPFGFAGLVVLLGYLGWRMWRHPKMQCWRWSRQVKTTQNPSAVAASIYRYVQRHQIQLNSEDQSLLQQACFAKQAVSSETLLGLIQRLRGNG
jgi:hypothetical protein